ncbi:MAG TPA: hypothetical protein VHH54_06325 [Actinomycetota bacterium]|nr:hypothetical protein [Actinomycetota bacterium]
MAQNAARSLEGEQMQQPPQRVLRSVPSDPSDGREHEVVAEILSDGTVRPVASPNGHGASKPWSEGSISGRSWILWWNRRSFSQA